MAYIGNRSDSAFTSLLKQDLTGASGTSLTLTHAVANANDIALYINNVRQEPTEAYSVNGTIVTLTGTVSNSDDIYVIYLARAVQTTVPPDGSVGTAKIADSAVDLTSKVTGTLPTANGGNGFAVRPAFDIELFKTTSGAAGVNGVIQFNGITTNQGSHWDSTNHRFVVPNTGMYQFNFNGTGTRTATNGVMTSASPCQVVLEKSTDSGSSYTMVNSGVYSYFNANSTTYGGYLPLAFSCVLTLNSGDYVQYKVQTGFLYHNTKASNLYASASGFQI